MDSSLTVIVQNQVDEIWKQQIRESDFERSEYVSGHQIREYLNDRNTLNTVSFVIRRYLQLHESQMLERIRHKCGLPYADLTAGLNYEWPEAFNLLLSKELFAMSKKRGIVLSASTWNRYLANGIQRLNGDTLFRIAFSLQMSVPDTQELMLASGHDTYCMRDPRHFIFYYCQKKPNAYSWLHADELIQNFEERRSGQLYTANHAREGMTMVMGHFVDRLINSSKPKEEADDELLRFMLMHEEEFSGLELTKRKDLLRMAQYLACLYPNYTHRGRTYPVTVTENGVKLDELVRALFSEGGWLGATVSERAYKDTKGRRTSSSIKRRQQMVDQDREARKRYMEADAPFLNNIQFFVDHFSKHLAAIDRVYRSPDNAQNVERRDVILFTYFFIRQYAMMVAYEDDYDQELGRLTGLLQGDSSMDECMDDLIGMIYELVWDEEADLEGNWDYMPLFNRVLEHFHLHPLYMPCPYDRFIYMSLFAQDPSSFTEAVLWNLGTDDTGSADNESSQADQMISRLKQYAPYLLHENTNEKIAITSPNFAIGRYSKSEANQNARPDYGIYTIIAAVSRRHALLLFDGQDFWVADVSKVSSSSDSNRTRLNGVKLQPNGAELASAAFEDLPYKTKIKEGDHISICMDDFTFHLEGERD